MKMAPLSLTCPLCCNEIFSSHISLKYHLLSMIDNLLCPSCGERCDDLMDMADHLGRECKNLEKSSTDKILPKPVVSNEKEDPVSSEVAQEPPKTESSPEEMKNKVPDVSIENNEPLETGQKIIDIDQSGNIKERIDDKPIEEADVQMMYTCQMCNISFNSVQEHLAKYHEGEEVLLETEENENGDNQLEELTVMEYHGGTDDDMLDDEESIEENVESIGDALERTKSHEDETLSEQPMVDKTGMGYMRKVVKVGTDWIKDSQEPESQENNGEQEELEPDTTKYIVEDGKVRIITEEDAAEISDKTTIIEVHKCPNCNLQFPNMTHFKKHNCKHAKSSVSVSKERKNQLLKIKEELKYQCTFCLAIYSSLIALNDHMKAHLIHDETGMVQKKTITMTLHVCDVCKTKFPTYKQLRLHSRMHEPVKTKEVEPPVSYNIMGQSNEENEEPNNTERETFQCHICERVYDKEYEEVHMKYHEEQENIVCLVCNRKFDTRENLEMHMKAHSNTKKFACSYCKKPFVNYSSLEDHVLNHCQKRQYECQYCGRRFARPHEKKYIAHCKSHCITKKANVDNQHKVKHERIHTGEKPHVCQVCGRAFRISYCLTLHMRTHTNTRPYSCMHCGKRFKSHSVFNHHMQTHSEERNYKCSFCPKAFKTAVQLAGHKNSHTKPFSCTECNRPFASLYAVRAHMETHKRDNNLKFDCWMCGASYARSFALRDHMSTAHGQTSVPGKDADDNALVKLENPTNESMEHADDETEEHQQEGEEDQIVTEGDDYHMSGNEGEVQVLSSHEEGGNENYEVHLQEVDGEHEKGKEKLVQA